MQDTKEIVEILERAGSRQLDLAQREEPLDDLRVLAGGLSVLLLGVALLVRNLPTVEETE